jgi:hypothetical protein
MLYTWYQYFTLVVVFWPACFTSGKTEEAWWAPELVWSLWRREEPFIPASKNPTRSGRSLRRLQAYNKLIYFNSHIHNPTLRPMLTPPSPPTRFNVVSLERFRTKMFVAVNFLLFCLSYHVIIYFLSNPTLTICRGGSRFCGARNLYNFWSPLSEKEYKIGYQKEYLFIKRK